jgi:hypothetical protein
VTGTAVVQVTPVVQKRRRLERVRIAQPQRGAAAPEERRTLLNLGVVKIQQRV